MSTNDLPLITIIVPLYNSEKYLDRCLQSILSQDYNNIGLILVNDGSTDSSTTICEKYAAIDNRVQIFHQENKGVSAARNLGIAHTNGKYIWFVDSDDWIDSDCVRTIVSELERNTLDVLQVNVSTVMHNEVKPLNTKYSTTTKIMKPDEYVTPNLFIGGVCGSIFRYEICLNNRIKFETRMNLAEDQIFMLNIFSHSERVQRINLLAYYYFRHDKSKTFTSSIGDILFAISYIMNDHCYHRFKSYCDYLVSTLFYDILNIPIHYLIQENCKIRHHLFYLNKVHLKIINPYLRKYRLYYLFDILYVCVYKVSKSITRIMATLL
jgi:glycosyltransferase involved in cell wall biosynthesis